MASLRPMVDFVRLRAGPVKGTGEDGGDTEPISGEGDATIDGSSDRMVDGGTEDILAAGHQQGNGVEGEGAARHEEGLCALFGDDDVDDADSTTETVADMSVVGRTTTNSKLSVGDTWRVFAYDKTKGQGQKMYSSPQKLVSERMQDTRRFTTISDGWNRWIEKVEVGPLTSSTAKSVSFPKGSVLQGQPDMCSVEQEDARQLACLKLLLLITPETQRDSLAKKMSTQVRDIWYEWIEHEVNEKRRRIEELAEMRVLASERSVEGWTVCSQTTQHDKDASNNISDNDEVSGVASRRGLSCAAVHRELEERSDRGLLRHEEARAELPMCKSGDDVVRLIERNEVTIVCGETGSGKSTQVPQLLLRSCSGSSDEMINIIVTEPRRVAAVSVSSRVGTELGDTSLSHALTGYTVRLDSKVGPRCVVEYVTTGVLLRRIQSTKGAMLKSYSHVIVDEVHERSVDSDLLLLLLKQYKQSMKQEQYSATEDSTFPRIVLMSATADADSIASYWSSVSSSVSATRITGRAFPVEALYLEDAVEQTEYSDQMCGDDSDTVGIYHVDHDCADNADGQRYSARTLEVLERFSLSTVPYDLILHIIRYELLSASNTTGAVLVFVPGMEEIRRTISLIESCRELSKLCITLPMHSSLPFDDLQRAFRRAEGGKRKVIVSTNICETGVTIEDVDLVLDAGLVKSVEWNEVTELSRLRMHYCSVAESMQRRGRAGRVRPGRCYHLFPRCIMEGPPQNAYGFRMKRRPDPEMARAPLTSPILNLIDQGFEPALLLTSLGDTVRPAKLKNALQTLLELRAIVESQSDVIDDSEATGVTGRVREDGIDSLSVIYSPTPLGRMLAVLPCDPRSGKILLAARRLECLYSAAVYVASLDCKSVFMRNEFSDSFFRDKFMKRTDSDAATIVNAYTEWVSSSSKHKWCRENGVAMAAMIQVDSIAKDLMKSMDQFSVSTSNVSSTDSACHTCRYNTGMHTCVTGGSLQALLAAIASGMGNSIALRASPPGATPVIFLSGAKKGAAQCSIGRFSLVSDPEDWILYNGKIAHDSSRQSISNVSSVHVNIVMLFSPWAKCYIGDGTIILASGIGVKCRPQLLVALRRLKAAWEIALCDNLTSSDSADMMALIFRYLDPSKWEL